MRPHLAIGRAGLAACAALSLPLTGWRGAPDGPRTGSVHGVVALDGTVRYAGTPPAPAAIDMTADPYCAAAHPGAPATLAPVRTNADGRLRNAIVYVRQGLAAQRHPMPAEPVLLDQRGCIYEPHVVALRAGQTLLIRNSDATLHNVHVTPKLNRGFNIGQPIRGIESRRVLDRPEVGIPVACDIHGWMGGVIAVFDHPFFAVTDDDGTFSLDGLPAGNYVIDVWHETLGTQSQQVTVPAGGQATAAFTYPGS